MSLFSGDSKSGAKMLDQKDDSAPPPPYYQHAAMSGQAPMMGNPVGVGQNMPQMQQPQQPQQPQQAKFRFPQAFGIYHAPSTLTDMCLSLSKDDPNPMNYITTHNGLSSQPSVVLHSTPSSSSPPLATADFHALRSLIDLTIYLPANQAPQTASLVLTGAFSATRSFSVFVPSTNRKEAFEWKNSRGQEVQSLQGRSHGKKCVRVSTGEVVAVFTAPHASIKKKGKMEFLVDRVVLGEVVEVAVVLALVAIIEKQRRTRNNSAATAAAAG